MPRVELEAVSLSYPLAAGASLLALDEIELKVESGEFLALVGPSGCGKSSLLLLVNGLLRPSSGQVRFDDRLVDGPSADRALVFQDYGLLPWRTVLGNVELGLELRRLPRPRRRAAALRQIRQVGLSGFEQAYPHQLSGGMRQRVGLARALAVEPHALLLDEPFGALDAQLRLLMGEELLRLWERDRLTMLFVTHDIDEAIFLADRVIVMSARPGRIIDSVAVDFSRPRRLEIRDDPGFSALRRRIWNHLEREVVKSLADAEIARADVARP